MKVTDLDWKAFPIISYTDAVQEGQAPLFISTIEIDGATNFIVKRADGSFARLVQQPTWSGAIVQGTPTNTRKYLQEWIDRIEPAGKLPVAQLNFKRKLVNDLRMRDFWDWFERVEYKSARSLQSSLAITESIWRATKLPGKPGNMTPRQREAYFESVRKHACALIELLNDTKFDGGHERLLSDEELNQSLDKTLYSFGEDEADEGHVVGFRVTSDEKYQLQYDYPDCALVETLGDLRDWTYWDDQWDGRFFSSSDPIVQSNSRSTPVVYFTCTVYGKLSSYGVEMPFPILATLTNVALDLPVEDEVDEDTVRRQVRRYQERMAERDKARSIEDWEGGQISSEVDDSVLFPPF